MKLYDKLQLQKYRELFDLRGDLELTDQQELEFYTSLKYLYEIQRLYERVSQKISIEENKKILCYLH